MSGEIRRQDDGTAAVGPIIPGLEPEQDAGFAPLMGAMAGSEQGGTR